MEEFLSFVAGVVLTGVSAAGLGAYLVRKGRLILGPRRPQAIDMSRPFIWERGTQGMRQLDIATLPSLQPKPLDSFKAAHDRELANRRFRQQVLGTGPDEGRGQGQPTEPIARVRRDY